MTLSHSQIIGQIPNYWTQISSLRQLTRWLDSRFSFLQKSVSTQKGPFEPSHLTRRFVKEKAGEKLSSPNSYLSTILKRFPLSLWRTQTMC